MKKLLIVEDEKMIREGIKAIVLRSPIEIGEVITCKNGEEAYEIVKNQKIDVMITDIRMPKKDGITLVKEISNLPFKPKVVVVSGFDDFSYAVEFLHYGAKEYILKPIEREKIHEVLIRLERELDEESKQQNGIMKIGFQELRQILLNENINLEEIERITTENFESLFMLDGYVVCCTNYKKSPDKTMPNVIFLEDIYGQNIYVVNSNGKDVLLRDLLKNCHVGISRIHSSIKEFKEAYKEALCARKNAFATSKFITEYSQIESELDVPESKIDQFVQMIGTNRLSEAQKFLAHILYKTKQGQINPDIFCNIMTSIVEKICFNYRNVLDIQGDDIAILKNIYGYDDAESYYYTLSKWIETIHGKISIEFDDYKNKQKIQKVLVYIHENYNKNLNMAVVSNYVSMNYSLFSSVFKQYTGMNFVDYVKTLRIKEAKKLLEETDMKIFEISNLIGYENEKNFMKVFKKDCGVSPKEYRKNIQIGRAL